MAAFTDDGAHCYTMAGAMGGAAMIGLGLAQDKRKLVVTGDGELLMNAFSVTATIRIINPPNLAILCVDNGHYGETRLSEKPHQPRGRPRKDRHQFGDQGDPLNYGQTRNR